MAVYAVATSAHVDHPAALRGQLRVAEPERTHLSTTPAFPVDAAIMEGLPEATTWATTPQAPVDTAPTTVPDGLLVTPKRLVPIFDSVGGNPIAKIGPRQLDGPTAVPVLETAPGWLRIALPSRPHGATGWITDWEEDLEVSQTDRRIMVDLHRRELSLYQAQQVVGRWKVGIGKDSAPTPVGRTFVLAQVAPANIKYSPFIVVLGTHSLTHEKFGAGPGTVGVHGWPRQDGIGTATSDGCIRIGPEGLRALGDVPIGTPVLIS
ncbi:L,D-transpeptidase [Crossiella sp. SN42]|uniref:L,D-transpeptidase n=1 Tax=Crossiella sp. SN42 TaxID=2944808 RepID=UPI00207CCA69|nr:L,D-transpeptidase [Crossiella sp. SN42]MCO1575576.1 L,D-transpeptidase [Crossiella sp. SN42]